MIYNPNPLTIWVKNQEDTPDDQSWGLLIGSARKVKSYLHQKDKDGTDKLMILFSGKWYEISRPEMDVFFFLCPHLKRKGMWLRIKYLFYPPVKSVNPIDK